MPDLNFDITMFLDDYLSDCQEGFQAINTALLTLEKAPGRTDRINEIFRHVHTLKSSSAMLKFSDVAEVAHACEDILDRLKKQQLAVTPEVIEVLFEVTDTLEVMVKEHAKGRHGGTDVKNIIRKMENIISGTPRPREKPAADKSGKTAPASLEQIHTVKVNIDLLDDMFNIVGELIINKKRLDNIVTGYSKKELKSVLASMERMIKELQEDVSAARLVPVGEVFQKFPRMVRDLAREASKEIELIVEGGEIELDKAILDTIGEPLIHLLRNAVDHGIEAPELRQQNHKSRAGSIKLSASRMENYVLITVSDDGAGIDPEHLRKAFKKKGLITDDQAGHLKDSEILGMLFEPGMSSSDKVTEVSGRGMGLYVVKNSVKGIGGLVDLKTEPGKGTTFSLKLPLTTAVMQTLLVGLGDNIFAIPSDIVQETLEVKPRDIKEIHDRQALVFHKEVIPFVKLNQVLNQSGQEQPAEMIAVIVHNADKTIGLGVDSVIDQAENIIKPFDPLAQQFVGFSGGTILGDGRVALLLDIPELLGSATMPV